MNNIWIYCYLFLKFVIYFGVMKKIFINGNSWDDNILKMLYKSEYWLLNNVNL